MFRWDKEPQFCHQCPNKTWLGNLSLYFSFPHKIHSLQDLHMNGHSGSYFKSQEHTIHKAEEIIFDTINYPCSIRTVYSMAQLNILLLMLLHKLHPWHWDLLRRPLLCFFHQYCLCIYPIHVIYTLSHQTWPPSKTLLLSPAVTGLTELSFTSKRCTDESTSILDIGIIFPRQTLSQIPHTP